MARKEAGPLPAAALVTAVLSLGLFLVAGGASHGSRADSRQQVLTSAAHNRPTAAQALRAQPLAFEPAGHGSSYLVRDAGYALTIDRTGTRLTAGRATIRTRVVGAGRGRVSTGDRQSLVVNRYQGGVSRTGIPTVGRVTYESVYPGVDLVYHGRGGRLEYDFELAPRADPARIELAVSGAANLRIDSRGDLLASNGAARLRQHRPIAYQQVGGERRYVDARFVIRDGRVRFAIGSYDRSRALVIDPTLTYSDFIGGAKNDSASKVALDSAGNIYVVGTTTSTSIPGTSGSRSGTDQDAFVLKIAPDHTRSWITYLGGTNNDSGTDIGLDSQGRPYISGTTASGDFPDGDGFGLYGPQDSFNAAFTTDGQKRWAGTWGIDDSAGTPTALTGFGNAIAVQGDGTTYTAVSGQGTVSMVAKQAGLLVTRDASGSVVDAIVAQGPGLTTDKTTITALGITPGCTTNCTVYFAGHTDYTFTCPDPAGPVTVQVAYIGAYIESSGTTPWGGNGYNYYFEDCKGGVEPTALDVSHHGDPVITGFDLAPGDTASHAFLARFAGSNGARDAFPFVASKEGSSLGTDLAHDELDNIIFTEASNTATGDLPGAIQSAYNGGFHDGAVYKLNPDGPAITEAPAPGTTPHEGATIPFATLFGGTSDDLILGAAAGPGGDVYLVGGTQSLSKFPIQSNTQDPQIQGALADAFIAIIRPNHPRITDGPNGVLRSRDAKFTFTTSAEPGFNFSVDEVGTKFQCKLTPVNSDFGPCPSDGYKGLGEGSYKFEVRAIDQGGTITGVDSRDFTVNVSPQASFTIAPNPALVGRTVTFDAAASVAATPISKYEWDLDGNGSFETNTGTTHTVTQTYPSAGSFNVGLRITDGEGRTGTTTNALQVNNATGPGTQFGVTINDGAQFTNDPDVVVTATFPSFTTGLLFSNDGGFGKAQTFAAKKTTKWKLDSSGPERLPKTIYVRFLTGSIASTSYQDDIILDETPPKVDQAQVAPAAGATAGRASAAKLRKYRVTMKASDKTSGVSKVQVTANKKKPGKALKYKRKFVVKSAKRPKWVRARDRAGNWSKWKKAR